MLAKQLNYIAKNKRQLIYDDVLNHAKSELINRSRSAAEDGKFGLKHQLILNEEFTNLKQDLETSFQNDGFEVYINASIRCPYTENIEYVYDILLRWG